MVSEWQADTSRPLPGSSCSAWRYFLIPINVTFRSESSLKSFSGSIALLSRKLRRIDRTIHHFGILERSSFTHFLTTAQNYAGEPDSARFTNTFLRASPREMEDSSFSSDCLKRPLVLTCSLLLRDMPKIHLFSGSRIQFLWQLPKR